MKSGSLSPKNRQKQELGRRGEDRAAAFLLAKGYVCLARNWRCKAGEIDLVVQKDGDIRFVEVKTRRSMTYGGPEEAITAVKLRHMREAAEAWLEAWDGPIPRSYQVDVITLFKPEMPDEELLWIEQVL